MLLLSTHVSNASGELLVRNTPKIRMAVMVNTEEVEGDVTVHDKDSCSFRLVLPDGKEAGMPDLDAVSCRWIVKSYFSPNLYGKEKEIDEGKDKGRLDFVVKPSLWGLQFVNNILLGTRSEAATDIDIICELSFEKSGRTHTTRYSRRVTMDVLPSTPRMALTSLSRVDEPEDPDFQWVDAGIEITAPGCMYGVIQVYSKYSINVYYIDVGSVVDKTNFIYEYGCIGDSLQFHSCNDYGGGK